MTRSLWLIFIALVTLSCQAPDKRPRAEFQTPAKSYRPMVRWWWPGGDVTDAELRREVRLLDEANFGGAEIQPFVIGLNPKMPEEVRRRVNNYLTPEFFAHVRAALDEARSRGMWLDYTFGSGWPFGGGKAITPELASLELRYAHQSIQGPVRFHGKLTMPRTAAGMGAVVAKLSGVTRQLPDGWPERLKARSKLVAVVAIRGEEAKVAPRRQQFLTNPDGNVKETGFLKPGTAVVLTDRLLPDGTLDWEVPAGTWQVFTFKQFPADLRVIGGAGEGPQLVLDHMNREAFAAHAHRVGDSARQYVGEFFGHGLRAIFCDSLEVHAYLFWSNRFLGEFRKRRGYDLTPYLPILKVPGFADPYGAFVGKPIYDIPGIGDRVRHDYWQTVSDVMIENFYEPFNDWAARNNLLSRVQAHGAPADVLRIYGEASIPETEDLYDKGRYDFLKMAASAAHVYGRKIASSESFVWMGKAYQTTPEKIKRYADELITAGINEIIYHGFPYDYMDRPEPGWHPFSAPLPFSSHMNQHNPFWRYLPRLNTYITRLQFISQEGTNVAPVALYRGALSYDAIEPAQPEPEINTRLMTAGYNFDHINADALLKSKVAGGKLVSPGRARYGVLVLQNECSVPLEVVQRLAAFAEAGLPVLFIGRAPESEVGFADYKHKTEQIRRLMKQVLERENVHLAASVEAAVSWLNKRIAPNLRFPGTAVPFIEKRLGKLDAFFLRNPDPEEKHIEAEFAVAGSPQLWDPWTGNIRPLLSFQRRDGVVKLPIELASYGSALIVFDPDDTHEPGKIKKAVTSGLPEPLGLGEQGWRFHGVGLGRDGKTEIRDLKLTKLIDWSEDKRLKSFSGRGEYRTTFALPSGFTGNDRRIVLDLGQVRDVAEITINGKRVPALLMRPYEVEVTSLLKPGDNTLQVTVVNTLYNALAARGTNVNRFPGMPGLESPLMPSGLIGPVRLRALPR